ncbi:hypothetical protein, partial [Pseudomonas savastanoi]|uniref:hypothetical protein n=1 Tax=Pseudomonas savastanoi TaxID=29438 RepID=UPI001C80E634
KGADCEKALIASTRVFKREPLQIGLIFIFNIVLSQNLEPKETKALLGWRTESCDRHYGALELKVWE